MKKAVCLFVAALFLLAACQRASGSNSEDGGQAGASQSETQVATETEERKNTETAASDEDAVTEEGAATEEEADETEEIMAELTDDLADFQVKVGDTLYQLPMSYSKFTSYGWEFTKDDSYEMDTDTFSGIEVFRQGNIQVEAILVNLYGKTLPISECIVGSIIIEESRIKNVEGEVVLAKSIVLGASTLDDIIAAYGNPDEAADVEGEAAATVTYIYDSYQEVVFTVSTETNILTKVQVMNMRIPSKEQAVEETAE